MISIVMSYYNRKAILLKTIESIKRSNVECEIIVVDDASDQRIEDVEGIRLFRFSHEIKWWTCPVIPYNKGIAMAKGDTIIIQCPESFHVGDVLKEAQTVKDNEMLSFACYALTQKDTDKLMSGEEDIEIKPQLFEHDDFGGWYQHSQFRNDHYHWCCAMRRKDLLDLGGFDERYARGIACGDADFVMRVKRKGMSIRAIDYPHVYHVMHERAGYLPHTQDNDELFRKAQTETEYRVINSYL